MITKRGIVILTTFSFVYALLELGMVWDPSRISTSPTWMKEFFTPTVSLYFYRVMYTILFTYPSYLASGKLFSLETLWYLIYGSTIEDIIYWILDVRVPYSWAWFYPVCYGIPIDDLIGVLLLLLIKRKIKEKNKIK
ncbi:hypothetical protein [Sulfurisphaera ohwakuensis]|uniref:Uncharacterized protein n=1 Tax=Sulfurisphaera ohwakuensis TaxID=69656 RepID=A0A650CFD4_SULOH|nr:hypothetical protein [Sulfurisphaera ohwakuensis]MBB5255039.1 hypothetical protein [Sulfurisphaera ohwakuensis]QGR16571.1 hypothetical protein D1869_04700 [Sulfurisphaera ohwakuensis]